MTNKQNDRKAHIKIMQVHCSSSNLPLDLISIYAFCFNQSMMRHWQIMISQPLALLTHILVGPTIKETLISSIFVYLLSV